VSVAALIRNGVVVNVAAYDEVASASWLAAVTPDYDEVRVVEAAGIGWTVEDDGLRPLPPFPSWSWNGAEWAAPDPKPDGEFVWDEDAGDWVAVQP